MGRSVQSTSNQSNNPKGHLNDNDDVNVTTTTNHKAKITNNNHQRRTSRAGNNTNTNNNNRKNKNPKSRFPPRHQEVTTLLQRIQQERPPQGSVAYDKNAIIRFDSLPISQATLAGLQECGYTTMTSIQSMSIPHALAGRDILGAAQTGSGKTLAFLVPLLERLYRSGYTPPDGVGAIVLSPTRELAGQIFAVLRKVGRYHPVSLGLLMGGRHKDHKNAGSATNTTNDGTQNDFQKEQQALPTTNILICTPGRLLQHLEQTPYFHVDGVQMVVLDEADRILDMGFREQLVQILDYLPKGGAGEGGTEETNDDDDDDDGVGRSQHHQRQTLLFSATQTKDVKHLATLSINHRTVEYVGVHDQDAQVTPERLTQSYVVVPIQHKLDCLFSFLKTHLQHKTIVFFATCSQVRHGWDLFCRLRPGLSVLALHGKLSQTKRLQVYDKFTTTQHCALFATDVASRGLDFPYVDWVVQVDAPEDYAMYVHRVGRTARFNQSGQALLLLDPSEEGPFIHNPKCKESLKGARIVKKNINPTKTMVVTQRAAALVAEHNSLYSLAKKAFWSYVRSVSLLPREGPNAIWADLRPIKEMMNVSSTSTSSALEAFAISLGLPNIPGDVQSMLDTLTNRDDIRKTKNVNRKLQKLKEQIRLEKEEKRNAAKKRTLGEVVAEKGNNEGATPNDDDDDLLVVKARHEASNTGEEEEAMPLSSTAPRKSKRIRIDRSSTTVPNKHIVFEDDGTERPTTLFDVSHTHGSDDDDENSSDGSDENTSDNKKKGTKESKLLVANESYLERVRQRLEQTKDLDKQEERDRIRAKHKKKRLQEKTGGNDDVDDTSMGNNNGNSMAVLDMPKTNGMEEDDTDDEHDHDDDGNDDNDSSSSEDASNSHIRNGSAGSDDSEEDDDASVVNIEEQEDLALSLIRGRA